MRPHAPFRDQLAAARATLREFFAPFRHPSPLLPPAAPGAS